MQEAKTEELIDKLRQSARMIAYYATLCGRGDEVGTAIGLSPWYALCRGVAAPEFLTEIVSGPVDEGIAAGRAELQRIAAEKQALADGHRKLEEASVEHEQTLADERERLAATAHGYQRAEAGLAEKQAAWERQVRKREEQLQHRAAELDGRESCLGPFEDLQAGRATLASDREAFDRKLAAARHRLEEDMRARAEALEAEWAHRNAELTAAAVAQARRGREIEARHSKEAALLQARERALHKSGRRWLTLQAVVFAVLVGTAFLPVRDRLVAPFLAAREGLRQERERLRADRDMLTTLQADLKSRESAVRSRTAEVNHVANGLDGRRAALRETEQKLQQRERELSSWEAALGRWERDLTAGRQQLARQQADAQAAEARLRADRASFTQWSNGEAARLGRQRLEIEAQDQHLREVEEFLKPKQVTVVSEVPGEVRVEGYIGGRSVRFNGPGTASLSLERGRHSFTLAARAQMVTPHGLRPLQWSGEGYLNVFDENPRVIVRARYPRLWLEAR